jgi:hypothetical protein
MYKVKRCGVEESESVVRGGRGEEKEVREKGGKRSDGV